MLLSSGFRQRRAFARLISFLDIWALLSAFFFERDLYLVLGVRRDVPRNVFTWFLGVGEKFYGTSLLLFGG